MKSKIIFIFVLLVSSLALNLTQNRFQNQRAGLEQKVKETEAQLEELQNQD